MKAVGAGFKPVPTVISRSTVGAGLALPICGDDKAAAIPRIPRDPTFGQQALDGRFILEDNFNNDWFKMSELRIL